jgi:hypothetical protein
MGGGGGRGGAHSRPARRSHLEAEATEEAAAGAEGAVESAVGAAEAVVEEAGEGSTSAAPTPSQQYCAVVARFEAAPVRRCDAGRGGRAAPPLVRWLRQHAAVRLLRRGRVPRHRVVGNPYKLNVIAPQCESARYFIFVVPQHTPFGAHRVKKLVSSLSFSLMQLSIDYRAAKPEQQCVGRGDGGGRQRRRGQARESGASAGKGAELELWVGTFHSHVILQSTKQGWHFSRNVILYRQTPRETPPPGGEWRP